jgi:hypothetical protein
LVIAERTAARHIENIFNKLGMHSRAQIAAWAAQHGLLTGGLAPQEPAGVAPRRSQVGARTLPP